MTSIARIRWTSRYRRALATCFPLEFPPTTLKAAFLADVPSSSRGTTSPRPRSSLVNEAAAAVVKAYLQPEAFLPYSAHRGTSVESADASIAVPGSLVDANVGQCSVGLGHLAWVGG